VYYLAGPHPVNESFVRSPPSSVVLDSNITLDTFEDFMRPKEFSKWWKKRKWLADTLYRTLSIPRIVPVLRKCDLIHTNGGIIPLAPVPWIASVENPSGFYGFNEHWHTSKRMKRRLAESLLSRRCRAVLPYSEASRRYISISLCEWADRIEEKTTILYPAIDTYLLSPLAQKPRTTAARDSTRFLFVGDHFFDKGGREVLRAFQHVREEHHCHLTMVTSAPYHQRHEYDAFRTRILSTPDVNLIQTGIRRSDLLELYRSSDVFVFPSYMDQVPFVLLEAMAAKLALIGSNSYAIPEMAIEGENGFNIDSPCLAFPRDELRTNQSLTEYRKDVMDEGLFGDVADEIADVMARLAGSSELREKLGANSFKLVTRGRFSVRARNSVLSQIYADSIREE
jgi:glycosyltransferase involved in cell wall biosynthesis